MIKKQLETEKDLNVTQEVRGLAARPASARLLEAARQTPQEVFAAYETTPQGQPRPDIMRALFGRNELARKKADSILKRLFKAFINPFTVVLIVLAVISFITDYAIVEPEDRDLTAVLIVGIMVFISGTLRFVQEVRSGNAAERLQAMVKTTIAVLRDGESRERPISELVVGDVIRLAAGDMIPADVRIVETKDLFVSQSSLTGESEPMEKWTAAQPQTGGNPLECNNLAFMGSTVVSGSALALVIAVGKDTLFGALARRVAETRVRTNFEKGVNAVSWVLIRFMVGMVPVVLFLNGFTKGDWVQAALFALSVAVGLTPEMLPMIVSANLAKGAVAMSRKKVIVKHLNAIQNLGAMNILCTDKTGTLTQDRIVLEYPLDVHGNVDERVLRHAFLNSYHQTGLRNLMDEAIVDHAYETNMLPLWQDYRKVDEIPFDFTRRRKERISNRRVEQLVTGAMKAAGLRGFSTHKLRHTAATLMYQTGNVDILTLKQLLGHSSVGTTQIYTHLQEFQVRAAIEQNPLGEVKKASLDTMSKETGESRGKFADPSSDEPENDEPGGPMEAFEGAAQEGFRVDVSSLADTESTDK